VEKNDFLEMFMKEKKQYSDIMLAAAINAYLRSKYKNIKAYPKVASTLKRLKRRGLKLAVVTDAPKLKVLMRLEAMGVADLFDVVVSSEDVGRKKPSTILFRRALKSLKVKPEHALHLGDWRDKDVLGAKRVGMHTCIARYGDMKLGKKVWADHYIDRFEDILKIV
jgi:putative hydrolase of the HAD superfamily